MLFAKAPLAINLPGGKLRQAMLARALPHARRYLHAMLTRPLTLAETLAIAAALLAAGIIYCQMYCLLALQQMHGASMPLWASLHRASVDVLPAFVVFELAKRVPFQDKLWQWLALIALFGIAIAVAVAWRLQLHKMDSTLTPRRIAVDRIPFMALAAAGLVYFHLHTRLRNRSSSQNLDGNESDVMPPLSAIDWVKAAGNYVEVHFKGRTKLLRMTLRQAKERLPSGDFVQIHRSIIVKKERIAEIDPRMRVIRLPGGTELRVGDAYRPNLRRS